VPSSTGWSDWSEGCARNGCATRPRACAPNAGHAVKSHRLCSGGITRRPGLEGTPHAVKLVKRIALVLVAAFAVFYLVTQPQHAAEAVQGTVGAVWGAGVAVTDFFTALAG